MTTQQALDWIEGGWKQSPYAKTRNGQLGIDTDGLYGYQCKDFANAYADYLGAPFTAGNAITLWIVDQPGWTRVQAPQPGDVFVREYVGPDGVNYGHTGCVLSVGASGFTSVDQNWFHASLTVGSPPAQVFHPFDQSIKGYLRREGLGDDMITENGIHTLFKGLLHHDATATDVAYWLHYKDGSWAAVLDGIMGLAEIGNVNAIYVTGLHAQANQDKLNQIKAIVNK